MPQKSTILNSISFAKYLTHKADPCFSPFSSSSTTSSFLPSSFFFLLSLFFFLATCRCTSDQYQLVRSGTNTSPVLKMSFLNKKYLTYSRVFLQLTHNRKPTKMQHTQTETSYYLKTILQPQMFLLYLKIQGKYMIKNLKYPIVMVQPVIDNKNNEPIFSLFCAYLTGKEG